MQRYFFDLLSNDELDTLAAVFDRLLDNLTRDERAIPRRRAADALKNLGWRARAPPGKRRPDGLPATASRSSGHELSIAEVPGCGLRGAPCVALT